MKLENEEFFIIFKLHKVHKHMGNCVGTYMLITKQIIMSATTMNEH